MRIDATDIYLDTLTREDCKTLWNEFEYDLQHPTEEWRIGHSDEKAAGWFDEIQRLQGEQNVRLGIFLRDGGVIGDVALQDINRVHRSCSVGIGIAKRCHRGKGYGTQAVDRMLWYGFGFLGMERIFASTLEMNLGAQRSLEKCGFVLEGTEREAIYLNGRKWDRLHYAVLKRDYKGLDE